MTITEFQNVIRNNKIKLVSHPNYNITEKIQKEIGDCKVYESNDYFIKDIILCPNEITGYFSVSSEVVVITDYDNELSDKKIYKFTIHHYIKFVDKGKIILDSMRLICKESCRRDLQFTFFPKLESAKNVNVEFTLLLQNLTYEDLLIPDFNPSEIYPIYKRFIKEKYGIIIPTIKHLKEKISENNILFGVFSEDLPVKNIHDFSPFDYEEIKDQLNEEIIKSHFKLHECENKLYMINDWLRKIHYTYISDKNTAIKCKQYLIGMTPHQSQVAN